MYASAGDEIVVEGHHLGQPRRTGEILEVRGPDGAPPYLVQWDDSPHPVLFFPGSDARVENLHSAQS
jgi:uncharacterized protein DUF1918